MDNLIDYITSRHLEKPVIVSDSLKHSMNISLPKYLEKKVHHLVSSQDWERIIVIGKHNRNSIHTLYEKKDKPFNWQRPTATVLDNDLIIECYPGQDYVRHYSSIIATYLSLNGKSTRNVYHIIPTKEEIINSIKSSNLNKLGIVDVVVLGYVQGFDRYTSSNNWKGEGDFEWIKQEINGKTVAFVGCRHSYWGDIAGYVVKYLGELGIKKVIYVGKLGGMKPKYIPNKFLATGNISFVDGAYVEWNNLFEKYITSEIAIGTHYSLPSVLFETNIWLENMVGFDFVDPEIGHMAKAAIDRNMEFSYLHLITDNLRKKYTEDLSNERESSVLINRQILMSKVQDLLVKVI